MVRPPEAEPVSAARMLVAIASDTSGPPSIASTQSRTTANAGSAATTAPKPTRLATDTIGSTEALAPASMVARKAGNRRTLIATTVSTAASSATATDHTPLTADSEVAPHRGSARNEASMRGRTTNDITRLTAITTISGRAARGIGGPATAWAP